jgi:hypothetical protein
LSTGGVDPLTTTHPSGDALVAPGEGHTPYSSNRVERMSEKGFERRSEDEIGRYIEHEKSLWVLCKATLQAPPTCFGHSL